MILLNVSFGIFAFLPQGWLFMLFVILVESIVMSKTLLKRWYNTRIYSMVLASNFVSGVFGIILSLILNGGIWLVVWFPWVSGNELRTDNTGNMLWFLLYYLAAFVLSVLIEYAIQYTFLVKYFSPRQIFLATIASNVVSYTVGTFVLYSYSFGV